MIFLKQSTASQSILIGPFVDDTDGVTAETALTISNTDIRLSKNGGNMAAKNSGGGTHDENGWYTITLDATDTDTVGRLQISVIETGALPVYTDVQVLEEAVYDAMIGSGAGLEVDVTKISGDATAADNLESMYDGTGYADDDAPATQAQVSAIGSGSGAGFNFPVTADNTAGAIIGGITFVGSQTGTYTNTESNLITFHQISHSGNAIDIVYRVAGGATKTFIGLTIDAYLNSSNDELNIQLYDHVGADWETQIVLDGINGSAITEKSLKPLEKHTGALGTSEAGNLYVRIVGSAQSSPELYVARIIGEAITATSSMGYESGQVWVDEDNGTSTGTVQGVDGIFANQCLDFDDGQTIADGLGTAFIHLHPGNTITLTAPLQGYVLDNVQCTLTGGGGVNYTDSTRINGGFVTGTWTRAGTGIMTFSGCNVLNTTSARVAMLGGCGIQGTFTLSEAGFYPFVDCQAAGTTTPIIDFASLGGATLAASRWSGPLTVNNLAAGDTLSLHCVSGGDITINGTGATVVITGSTGTVTNNMAGGTFSDLSTSKASAVTALNDVSAASVADAVWDEVITNSLHNSANSAGKRLRQTSGVLAVESTVNDVSASTTVFVTNLTSAVDDFYNDSTITFLSGDLLGQSRVVLDYNGTTKAITVSEALTSAPGDTDEFQISSDHVHPVTQIQSGLATAASISALNDIAATDIVSNGAITTLAGAVVNVDLVDTTTTNTDMRGTDGANTTVPDAAGTAATLHSTTDGKIDVVDANIDSILVDTSTTIPGTIATVDANVDAILVDTGTTIPGQITALNDVAATDIVSNGAITTLAGAVVNVDLVDTTTTNTDMRGTDSAATASALATVDSNVDAILVDTGTTIPGTIATVDSNVDAILVDTGTTIPASISALNDVSVADVLTTQMTEAYAADGVAPTLAQSLFLIQQVLTEFGISGTTLTAKKLDGSTSAATFTLDDASTPTSLTRAS